jgi:hypothetical protein
MITRWKYQTSAEGCAVMDVARRMGIPRVLVDLRHEARLWCRHTD